jgi:NADH-quinone oxidoreductase subunit N
MNLAAFLIAGIVIRETGTADVYAMRGLGRRSLWLPLAFAIVLFSLTGLPPFFGFFAKLTVFYAVFEEGWVWLGVIGLLNGVVSLYYYARIIAVMYLQADETETEPAPARLPLPLVDRALCAALVLPVLVFGLWVSPVLDWANAVGKSLFR